MHFIRNALARAGKNHRQVVSALINTAFAQTDTEAARQPWRRVADQFRAKMPKLSALMDEAENDVLAYMTFPAAHRSELHSTNPLERVNGEIKRRTDVVGIFPNEDAMTPPTMLPISYGELCWIGILSEHGTAKDFAMAQ